MSGRDYARMIPMNYMRRAKTTPRVARYWRITSLTKLTSFYRNRFYEMDRWYKARIPPPPFIPECYEIDSDNIQKSLVQRLHEMNMEDPDIHQKVNIGLKYTLPALISTTLLKHRLKQGRKNVQLEREVRNHKLKVDLEAVEEESKTLIRPDMVCCLAKHYRIFQDSFHQDAYFYPVVPLNIYFSDSDSFVPVYYGNIVKPSESLHPPTIEFEEPLRYKDSYWMLVMVNIDGNLFEENSDVLHWAIGNIKGKNIDGGRELCAYLQPLPTLGTGYHRFVFALFRQDNGVIDDFGAVTTKSNQLKDRTINLTKYYKEHEKNITPAGLLWFQSDHDISVEKYFFENLGNRPHYDYEWPSHYLPPQKEYAKKKAFNEYFDLYRDEKDVQQEVLQMRIKSLNPFKPPPKPMKYAIPLTREKDVYTPSWLEDVDLKSKLGLGKWKGLYHNRLS